MELPFNMQDSNFGQLLTKLRQKAGLTNKTLAINAAVPCSLIAGLQSGRRRIGEFQANKIGVALGLEGAELESFILAGVNTSTEKVLVEAKEYPSTFLNMVAKQLRLAGILPQHLSNFRINGDRNEHVLKLYMNDGRTACLSSTLTLA